MKKRIIQIGIICTMICIVAFILYLLTPVRSIIHTTTKRIDYLKFDKAAVQFLKNKDFFLPNDTEVRENDHAYYSYIYKPEDLYMDEFCIHLSMYYVNTETINEYLSHIEPYTACIHFPNGEDIWLSKKTEESIEEILNTDAHDGMPLFFYIFKISKSTESIDFWVCKLEDAGPVISPEFVLMIERIQKQRKY